MVNKFRESTTFKLVLITWVIITIAFIKSYIDPLIPVISITEYATATGIDLAIWLGREWRAAHYPKDS